MKLLLDFIPLILFFALYKLYDIYTATGALIIATAVQLIVTYLYYKKIEKPQLITFIMVTVFGGMTLLLHNDDFIKWKVTVIYMVFALGLAISQLTGRCLIKQMLGKELTLEPAVWTTLSWAWTLFFSACAVVNLYVAFRLPLDVWVNFKVFGLLAATLAFTIVSGLYIYKHANKADKEE